MKYSRLFLQRLNCRNENEVFTYLIDNLKETIIDWDYFVDWGKVMSKVKGILKEVNPQHTFIWITDGLGWKKTQKPLREAFDTIDYILNLAMLEKGILEDIIVTNL